MLLTKRSLLLEKLRLCLVVWYQKAGTQGTNNRSFGDKIFLDIIMGKETREMQSEVLGY